MIVQLGIPMSTQERLETRAEKTNQSMESFIEAIIFDYLKTVDTVYEYEEWRKANESKKQLCKGECPAVHLNNKTRTISSDEVEFEDLHSDLYMN